MAVSLSLANNSASRNGDYSFMSVLGVGSFGTVMRAEDVQSNEIVAVKIVIVSQSVLDFLSRRQKLGEAKHEVDMLLQLKHTNVVALKAYFEFKEGLGIMGKTGLAMVMEFCEKGNLQEYLGNTAPNHLELPRRKLWYTQLSGALQFIHSKGIIHRDLKPPNILLDKDENLKIADVGLARTAWEVKNHCKEIPPDTTFNAYMSSLTGTPVYMAPEIWGEHYKMNSDVFSLGLIFVMIAVIPDPPIPYAYWEQNSDCLGKLLHECPPSRDSVPTDLLKLSFSHVTNMELTMFNNMLKYSYQHRISIEEVVQTIHNIQEEKAEANPDNEANPENDDNRSSSWRCTIS